MNLFCHPPTKEHDIQEVIGVTSNQVENADTHSVFDPNGLTVDLNIQSYPTHTNVLNKPPLKRYTRSRTTSIRYQDSYGGLSSTQNMLKSPHSLDNVISYVGLSVAHHAFISSLSLIAKPAKYEEFVLHQCWRDAMATEI